jgi:hypothetical protein
MSDSDMLLDYVIDQILSGLLWWTGDVRPNPHPVYRFDERGTVLVDCGHCKSTVRLSDTQEIHTGDFQSIGIECRHFVARPDSNGVAFCSRCDDMVPARWIVVTKRVNGCPECSGTYNSMVVHPQVREGRVMTPFLRETR